MCNFFKTPHRDEYLFLHSVKMGTLEHEKQERYEKLVQELHTISTNGKANYRAYYSLAQGFEDLCDYNDSAELASKCDTQYHILVEHDRIKKKKKILFWNIFCALLGGAIGGTIFYLFCENELDGVGRVREMAGFTFGFGIVYGLLFLLGGVCKPYSYHSRLETGCSGGCLGTIGGTIINCILGATLIGVSLVVSITIVGIIIGALIGIWIGYEEYYEGHYSYPHYYMHETKEEREREEKRKKEADADWEWRQGW
jgi:hypothetical protein